MAGTRAGNPRSTCARGGGLGGVRAGLLLPRRPQQGPRTVPGVLQLYQNRDCPQGEGACLPSWFLPPAITPTPRPQATAVVCGSPCRCALSVGPFPGGLPQHPRGLPAHGEAQDRRLLGVHDPATRPLQVSKNLALMGIAEDVHRSGSAHAARRHGGVWLCAEDCVCVRVFVVCGWVGGGWRVAALSTLLAPLAWCHAPPAVLCPFQCRSSLPTTHTSSRGRLDRPQVSPAFLRAAPASVSRWRTARLPPRTDRVHRLP